MEPIISKNTGSKNDSTWIRGTLRPIFFFASSFSMHDGQLEFCCFKDVTYEELTHSEKTFMGFFPTVYPPGNYHIPPGAKKNNLQKCLGMGYVSSQEGTCFSSASCVFLFNENKPIWMGMFYLAPSFQSKVIFWT